ncbi:hypothetical protein [Bacteroides eggerthii]|uniref:Uncharacterized protein n=1 Tax=Bacteroides eggerthii TaxID=28111 RepID=A0A7X9XJX5_9BACE|nr:hypothetical protein [Bacteroides eggerthii]NME87646.1 hypothetical protein [Bacteroides eggerthii]
MAKKIKIRVFNTLESNKLMASGWYSYKDNPNRKYGLFTGTTEGLEKEREVDCKKFMKPNVSIISTNLWQIYIKIRHRNYDLIYEHEYRNWNDDICIGWLRAGNLGGETVNWFFNGKKDCWYNGGEKGEALVVSHRVICGNIPTSDGSGNQPAELPNDTGSEGNSSPSGGHYVRPGSEESSSTSGGHYVRPGSEESSSTSGGHYVRPGSEGSSSTSGGHYVRPGSEGSSSTSGGHYVRPGSEGSSSTSDRLYPTGKGSILEKYMNEDGSPKESGRLYPKPLGWGNSSTSENKTKDRLYPTGKGSILEKYMNEDGSPKEPGRLYPKPLGWGDSSTPEGKEEEKDGPHYVRPGSKRQ